MTKESASRLSFLRSSGGPSRFPANAAAGLDRPLRSVINAYQSEAAGTRRHVEHAGANDGAVANDPADTASSIKSAGLRVSEISCTCPLKRKIANIPMTSDLLVSTCGALKQRVINVPARSNASMTDGFIGADCAAFINIQRLSGGKMEETLEF